MKRFEKWLKKYYRPEPQPWKRKALFWLSLFVIAVVTIGGYNQYIYHYTSDEVWWLYGFFAILAIGGLFTAIFGNEFWVALFLGKH
jgi:intracellular septation protein A